MRALRFVTPIVVTLGCTLGCAPRHAGPVTVASGCYALYADDWPPAVQAETGLRSLPSFIALDSATAGPRGRRVILPTTWEGTDPASRSAYWRTGDAGDGSLILIILGPGGDFTAALQPANDGYIGEGVGLGRRGALRPTQVHLQLEPTTCAGLTPSPGTAP